jgi:hypothetical protein
MLTWSANLDEVSSAEHTQGEVLPAGVHIDAQC